MQRRDVGWKSSLGARRAGVAALAVALGTPVAAQPPLQPGDAVRLVVLNEPELGGDFPVGADGRVLLPLVGSIDVIDRPLEEVIAEVRAGYARELAQPDIQVVPLVRVTVTGEARLPGVQLVDPTQTLAEVLATAGGVEPTAKRHVADLVRAGEAQRISIDAGSPDLEIHPRSGDTIHIPRRSWVSESFTVLIGAAATVAAAAVTSLILR